MPTGIDGAKKAPDPTEFYLIRRLTNISADPAPPSESSVTLYDVEVAHGSGGNAPEPSITLYNSYTPRPAAAAPPVPAPRIPAAPPLNWVPPFRAINRSRWKVAKERLIRLNGDAGGPDARHLQGHYRLEAVDPHHRMADALNPLRQYFMRVIDGSLRLDLGAFFEWLKFAMTNHPDWVREHLTEVGVNAEVVAHFMNHASVYHATSLARAATRITFLGQKMFRSNEQVFDTRAMETAFGGAGWAIYVVSPNGHWFCSNHRVGKLHHSTLLRGRPVIAAGEIQVFDGVPRLISAKSGHYRPTMDHFVAGVRSLRENGIQLSQLKVVVFDRSNTRVEIDAARFLNEPALQTQYKVWDL